MSQSKPTAPGGRQYRRWIGLWIAVWLLVSGCTASLDRPEQPVRTALLPLNQEQRIGQSFTADFDGLSGLRVAVEPGEPAGPDSRLIYQLAETPEMETILRQGEIPLAQIAAPGEAVLDFSPLPGSTNQDYFLRLKVEGPGSLQVVAADAQVYLDGALYRNGAPQEAQLTFGLRYSPLPLAAGLLAEFAKWLAWLLAAGYLFILPGWALLNGLWPDWKQVNWPTRLGASAGLSLALYPLLLLWTHAAGLQLGALYAWLPGGAAAIFLAWRSRRGLAGLPGRLLAAIRPAALKTALQRPNFWADLSIVLILILIAAARLWTVRGLAAPLWGDSYQHTMIVQRMLETGGLFDSWEPYVPYHSLTVHFGFHTAVALFAWLTQLEALQAVLVAGQILGLLAILTLAPLAGRLSGGNRWAIAGTLLAAGLIAPMPAFYVNWGRYAQLTGQAILPAAIWLAVVMLDWGTAQGGGVAWLRRAAAWKLIALSSLALAGMMLTYYSFPLYYATFLLAWMICWGLAQWKLRPAPWLAAAGLLAAVLVATVAMVAPWLANIAGGNLSTSITGAVGVSVSLEQVLNEYRVWLDPFPYLSRPLALLALAGLAWALLRRQWWAAAPALWFVLLEMYIAGRLFGLPLSRNLLGFAILIAAYIPAGLLAGNLLGELASRLTAWKPLPGSALAAAVLLLAAAWGAWGQHAIADPLGYSIVTRSDLRAFHWIQENTAPEATFLVEGFRIYDGSTAVGSDGGWWLALLAERANTMPPQYALTNERPEPPDYSQQAIDLIALLETNSPASPAALRELCRRGITHAYIGQVQGRSGLHASRLFTPEMLDDPAFELVYHNDRVSIFALRPDSCPAGE